MCGFVGFVNFKEDISNMKHVLLNMNSTISKRGPDEDGFYINNHVALAHKRLIVIDPNGGKQPMVEKCSYGEYVIVYNGQIYNTKELKETLVENGFSFNGHCDTEVLLKSYIYYGSDVVKHLNGIFSFAIWNSKTKELFIEILQEINSVARTERKEIEEKFLQTVAKKVVENEKMDNTREETQNIIEKLLSLADPFDNSKGNPIAIKMSKYDIERKFSRK